MATWTCGTVVLPPICVSYENEPDHVDVHLRQVVLHDGRQQCGVDCLHECVLLEVEPVRVL